MNDKIKTVISEITQEIIELRHDLHQHPELGFEETRTSGIAAELLRKSGLNPKTGVGKTGITCLIEGNNADKTLGLRADMDALPIEEQNEFAYTSANPGKMHACGHDGHTAILLGTAMVLSKLKSELNGNVKLIFQPSEEGVSGAKAMIADGAMINPTVDAILSLHCWPSIPVGMIGLKAGALMASADMFDITIHGKGGHGAYPQLATDPIYIGSLLVQALQGIVSRESGAEDPAVVSVTRFNAGTTYNVIPESALVSGTFRTLSETKRESVRERIQEVTRQIAKAYNAEVEIKLYNGVPVTSNDAKLVWLVQETITEAYGAAAVFPVQHPSMGAEDFAYYTQLAPGTMFFLGMGDSPMCHNPKFDFDDRLLPIGIELFTRSAIKYLNLER